MSSPRLLSLLIPIALLTPAACGSDDSEANDAGAPSSGGSSGSAGKASGGASGATAGSSNATGGKGNTTGGTGSGAGKGGTSASGGSTSGGAAGDGASATGGTGSSDAGAAGESNAGAATGGSSGTGGSGGSSDDPCFIPEAVGSCAMLSAATCSEYYKDYPLADACVQSGGEWADGPCPRDDLVAYCLNQFPEDDTRTLGAFYYAENPAYQAACGGDASWCLAK